MKPWNIKSLPDEKVVGEGISSELYKKLHEVKKTTLALFGVKRMSVVSWLRRNCSCFMIMLMLSIL